MYTHKKSIHMLIFEKGFRRKILSWRTAWTHFRLNKAFLQQSYNVFIIGSFTAVNMYKYVNVTYGIVRKRSKGYRYY